MRDTERITNTLLEVRRRISGLLLLVEKGGCVKEKTMKQDTTDSRSSQMQAAIMDGVQTEMNEEKDRAGVITWAVCDI